MRTKWNSNITEAVRISRNKYGEAAKVKIKQNYYSHHVQSPDDAVYCRNRRFLNKANKAKN
jgi:hypothetical protein